MAEKMGRLSHLPVPAVQNDKDGFFEQLLTGWKRAQFTKNFTERTVKRRLRTVMRFTDFTGKYPWEWTPADADEFFDHLRGVNNVAQETARAYQSDIGQFCTYITSDYYEWNDTCLRLFGASMSQIITDINRAKHTQEATMGPTKRAMDLDELQAFFDYADTEVERILRSRRKGAIHAWRDATLFKVCYGWGLRHDEARTLQVVDFSRSIKAPYFGDYGILRVRNGKANRGSPKKQRSVLTLVDWAAEAVADWIEHGLPRLGEPINYLFPTGTGNLVSQKDLWERYHRYLGELHIPPGVDIHGLRRSYTTHMITVYGYDEKFISMQLGHAHTATTTTYTLPSADFAAREMERVLTQDVLNSKGKLLLKPTRESRRPTK